MCRRGACLRQYAYPPEREREEKGGLHGTQLCAGGTPDHNLSDSGPPCNDCPMRTGVQPGSFDPPTLAHLAIAHAALRHHNLERIVWAVSRQPLGKDAGRTGVDDRLVVLQEVAADHPWLTIDVTDDRLVVDLADGYDVVVMGADKWHQLHDVAFYRPNHRGVGMDATTSMEQALKRLPTCAVAPRGGLDVPTELALPVPGWVARQSSTDALAGESWMALSAARQAGLWEM